MPISAHFLSNAPIINGEEKPFPGWIAGYTAIILKFELPMPFPAIKSMIAEKNQSFDTLSWKVLPKSYLPDDNRKITMIQALFNHLVFALKYEGVNLLLFAKLIEKLSAGELFELVSIEPTGQYSRRIWFLTEWISGNVIKGKNDLFKKSYVTVIDEKIQYAVQGIKSSRHLVINNLPGNNRFCAMITKTPKLEHHLAEKYIDFNREQLSRIRKDIIQRAAAFLLLKDSKASFTIEGENPKSKRAARWGAAIGQAGINELTKEELIRLQQLVIENSRFVQMGFREKGGFVGEHDRITGEPVPEHISARHQDLPTLLNGLIEANQLLIHQDYNAVLAAAAIAFGFIFIHPFEDGNGRIHRYLIHHILAKKQFTDQEIIFPVSSAILNHINDYRVVLEHQSKPLLNFIDWEETPDHNIHVKNETLDFYRFFDATRQAEFLFDCVKDTIQNIIPQEVNYLLHYERFKQYLEEEFEMPDQYISMLVRFLEQNKGALSKRAKEKEFSLLTSDEVKKIEQEYAAIFLV